MTKKQDLSKVEIPTGQFKHSMADPQFGRLVPAEYWSEGERFEGQNLYPEFWDDFEGLTGLKVPEGDRYSFFSCSC